MTGTLEAALACAAMLMGYTGPLPAVTWHEEGPTAELCALAGTPRCQAVVTQLASGELVVWMRPDKPFKIYLHESAHLIQRVQGRVTKAALPELEREARAIAKRAGECEERKL